MKTYSRDFYNTRHGQTIHAADTVLSILLQRLPVIHSAVDIGCGVGTWLSVLQDKGVEDILGMDGPWVDSDLLVIPRTQFQQLDLRKDSLKLPKRYDLAISLEVAEHLPAEHAEKFVSSLAELSDYVLFSAAIPFQKGKNHLNEQWQHYWVNLFEPLDYVVHDFIRPNIWNDGEIRSWYKQNILFFSRRERSAQLRLDPCAMPLNVVHPDTYLKNLKAQTSVKGTFKLFRRALGNYVHNLVKSFTL